MKINSIISLLKTRNPITLLETHNQSAVLVIMTYDEKENIFLITTKRSLKMTYAGDYCFPGGIQELSDVDLLSTAKREVREELGIREDYYQLIGQLDDFVDRRGQRVTPFVAMMKKSDFEQQVKVASAEVSAIYFFPLADLQKIGVSAELESITKRHPSYLYVTEEVKIWGLTASILVELGNIIFKLNRSVGKQLKVS
jgi:8-oxo-dGTP pyrophosphatase MutT (NUDIX family)